MRRIAILLAFLCISTAAAIAAEPAEQNQTMRLTNGAIATAYDHCGDIDLCAKIVYPNNIVLSIYSEGAALCQPYFLHFVNADPSGRTLFEFSRPLNHTAPKGGPCGHTVSTEMVLDRGYVHMLVTENTDGTLNIKFSVAKQ